MNFFWANPYFILEHFVPIQVPFLFYYVELPRIARNENLGLLLVMGLRTNDHDH